MKLRVAIWLFLACFFGCTTLGPGQVKEGTTAPSVARYKWSCANPKAQVSNAVLSEVADSTVCVHDCIGNTEIHVVPMVACSVNEASTSQQSYHYRGPIMARVFTSQNLYTVFHVFCAQDLPDFEWDASTLLLDDRTVMPVLTERQPFVPQWQRSGSHINAFLLFAELPVNATNVTLRIPYSRVGEKGTLEYHFNRKMK